MGTAAAGPSLPVRDQVLFSPLGSGTNFVYRRSDGTPVSARLGLTVGGHDDIDGICALDPGTGNQVRFDRMIGTPQTPLLGGVPGSLGTSLYRRRLPQTNQDQLISEMTGFPPPGLPAPGLAAVGIAFGTPTSPYATAALFVRPNPTSPYFNFQGHPEQWLLNIPSSPVWIGLPVFVVWAAFDGTSLDVSPPLGILL